LKQITIIFCTPIALISFATRSASASFTIFIPVSISASGDTSYCVDAFKVEPVDTTAAGDTFNGALCVGLAYSFRSSSLRYGIEDCAPILVTATDEALEAIPADFRKSYSDTCL